MDFIFNLTHKLIIFDLTINNDVINDLRKKLIQRNKHDHD